MPFLAALLFGASTQRRLIPTQCCGGVTRDFLFFFIVSTTSCLFVPLSHAPTVLSCFFFDSLNSTGALYTSCILYVASIVAGGYTGSLVLGDLVQRPTSLIAKCLLAKTSRFILSAFLIYRTACAEMVSVLLFYVRAFVPI